MLAVRLSLAALGPWLDPDVVVAGLNAPELNVVSGPEPAVRALEQRLSEKGVGCRRLETSHAFHSPLMDGALAAFRRLLEETPMQRPSRPWISCLTGDWVTAEQAIDPDYWVRQMRQPVRFSDGVRRLSQDPAVSFLEVGPGHGLASLVRAHGNRPPRQTVIASLGREPGGDVRSMLQALGALWVAGVTPNWVALHAKERRRRVDLPTYPFERERHWIDPEPNKASLRECAPDEAVLASLDPRQPVPASLDNITANDPKASVLERLRTLLSHSSGHAPEAISASQPFLELGFDSLLLAQVSAAIHKTFGVVISLRQFVERLTTLEALANHVQTTLGQNAVSQPIPAQREVGIAPHAGLDPAVPPVPGARLGRDAQGQSCWFVPDPKRPGKYLQVRIRDKAPPL
jgi:acyl transferase domain-containing protein